MKEKEVEAATPSARSTFKAEAAGTKMALPPAGPSATVMPASSTVEAAMLDAPITAGVSVTFPVVAAIRSLGFSNFHCPDGSGV